MCVIFLQTASMLLGYKYLLFQLTTYQLPKTRGTVKKLLRYKGLFMNQI